MSRRLPDLPHEAVWAIGGELHGVEARRPAVLIP